jgi:hypothetical protein
MTIGVARCYSAIFVEFILVFANELTLAVSRMYLIVPILIVLLFLPSFFLWRIHVNGFYALEDSLEHRLGPIREFYDGVGRYALTTSGLIPMLNRLRERFGDQFTAEEMLLERNARRAYYVGGSLALVGFASIFGFTVFVL